MSFKLDLHFHSESHGQTIVDHKALHEALKRNGLHGVAVTNFFDISHALWLKERMNGHLIIVGQEVWTKEGHILGLGLKERIDDFQSPEDTVGLIHEQGGIAIVPHPFIFLGIGEKAKSLPVDAIEVYSGLVGMTFIFNYKARKLANKMKVAQVSSSDTTDPRYIGHSHTEVMVSAPEDILDGIRGGSVKLKKRALPVPIAFIIKNFMGIKDIEPCSLHAVPCFTCGKSMVIGLFKKAYTCTDCGKEYMSRIACCNGHYLCLDCLLKRGVRSAHGKQYGDGGHKQ